MMDIDILLIRKTAGLSQAELARELGVTQMSVSRMETGKQPITPRTRILLERCIEKLRRDGRLRPVRATDQLTEQSNAASRAS